MGKTYIADSFKTTEGIDLVTEALMKGGYVGTAESLKNLIVSSVTGVTGISITPADAPTGTGIASWVAVTPGTYTNFGGVVVTANSLAVISRSAAGTFSISQTALNLTNYLQKTDNIKITPWTAKSYASGDQVNYLGKDWVSNAATVAGDVPGTSNKWVERLSGYGNEIKGKASLFVGKNKFNKNDISIISNYYLYTNGVQFASTGKYISHFIPIKAGEKLGGSGVWKANGVAQVLYDLNKNFLIGIENVSTVTASQDGYVKFSLTNIATAQIEFGTVATTYEDYSLKVAVSEIPDLPKITALESNKLDKVYSSNLLNPKTFRYNKFYYSGQTSVLSTGTNFGSTDYIPANVNGLITSGAGMTANGLSSYAVFDNLKNWIRNGQNSNQYTYVEGDGFVVFVYNGVSTGFALTKSVNVGTTLLPFVDYTVYEPLRVVEDKVKSLENTSVTVDEVKNGTPIVYGNTSNFIGGAITNRDVVNDSFVFNRNGVGNNWIYTPLFTPKGNNLINITFNIEFTKVGTTKGVILYVAKTTSSGQFAISEPIRENGSYTITFDPAYYNVYQGFTSDFYVWINNESILAGESFTAKFTGLKVLEYDNSVKGANISGTSSKELFESIDVQFTGVKSQLTDKASLVSSSGAKFELNISNTGVITSVPVIPNKGAFIGNSLLSGFGYGMAASESQYDYYNRINNFILTINPSYTFSKVSNNNFEASSTESELVTSINATIALLNGDENLVVIQLGDNVNTTAKNLIFNEGGGCLRLLQAVREKCPNARVVWMGMWYASSIRYATIEASCISTGSKFISFAGLSTSNSLSQVGNISKTMTIASKTITGVTSVVENTATNITVNFVYNAVNYTSTLEVTTYSLNSGTLTYTGDYEIIKDSGVASHPNDEGFRLISNKFLYEMKLTTDIEYYL